MGYWLFKSEPDEFSIDDLERKGPQGECWEGIRNYQARNFLRDQVQLGDLILFYHSSCKDIGVAGIAEVIKPAFADPFQFDPNSRYYDGKATIERPRWYSVQVAYKSKFQQIVTLKSLKANPLLAEFQLLKKGGRLSIIPVSEQHWRQIIDMVD